MPLPSIWEMMGGNTLSNNASATADPQTGMMSVTPGKAKHPFLSKMTGKDKELDKLNQAMQLIAAQRNSELGGAVSASEREAKMAETKAMIAQMMGMNIPVNQNTKAGYAAEAYPKGMFQGAQQVVQSGQGAAIGANQNAQSQAELIGKQIQARIDNFKPQDVIDEDKIAAKKQSMFTVPSNSITAALNASTGGADPLAYGSLENEIPMYARNFMSGEMEPTGKAYTQRVPGRVIRGNIMGDLQQPNGPALQLGAPAGQAGGNQVAPQVVPAVNPADTAPPQTNVNPAKLKIDNKPKMNLSYQLNYLLKSLGVQPGNSYPFDQTP